MHRDIPLYQSSTTTTFPNDHHTGVGSPPPPPSGLCIWKCIACGMQKFMGYTGRYQLIRTVSLSRLRMLLCYLWQSYRALVGRGDTCHLFAEHHTAMPHCESSASKWWACYIGKWQWHRLKSHAVTVLQSGGGNYFKFIDVSWVTARAFWGQSSTSPAIKKMIQWTQQVAVYKQMRSGEGQQ